jgi:hypothetical protein
VTSIICWRNKEEEKDISWLLGDGLWVVSDTRVSSGGNVMTDNCPKVFSISAQSFDNSDLHRSNPKCIFRFGFGFSGSTLIGSNVKEMLNFYVGNLSEVQYYDAPDYPYDDKLPSLMDVANLCKKLGEKYINSMGVCFPTSARCEFLVFGLCPKMKTYRTIILRNTPDAPSVIEVKEVNIEDQGYLVLGDKKNQVLDEINEVRASLDRQGKKANHAPLIAISNIIDGDFETIGGYVQLCISNQLDTRIYFLSSNEPHQVQIAGFSLMDESIILGGFIVSLAGGFQMPTL